MVDNKTGSRNWSIWQKQLFDTWSKNLSVLSESNDSQIHEKSLEFIRQWANPASMDPAASIETFQKLLASGQAYLSMKAIFDRLEANNSLDAQAAMLEWLDGFRSAFTGKENNVVNPNGLNELFAMWKLPLMGWESLHGAGQKPSDNLGGETSSEDLQTTFRNFQSMLLHKLSDVEKSEWEQCLEDYNQSVSAYMRYCIELAGHCADACETKIKEAENSASSSEMNARGFYDLWVETCDETYAKMTTSNEYIKCFGRLINSAMALKQKSGLILDDLLTAWNMPSRKEVDAVEGKLYSLTKENQNLKNEIELLKKEMISLKKKNKSVQSGRKKVARKKTKIS